MSTAATPAFYTGTGKLRPCVGQEPGCGEAIAFSSNLRNLSASPFGCACRSGRSLDARPTLPLIPTPPHVPALHTRCRGA